MSESSDDSVVSVIAAQGRKSSKPASHDTANHNTTADRKSTTQSCKGQIVKPLEYPVPDSYSPPPETNKLTLKEPAKLETLKPAQNTKSEEKDSQLTVNTADNTSTSHSLPHTKQSDDLHIPARARRRSNRSKSANKEGRAAHALQSVTKNTDPKAFREDIEANSLNKDIQEDLKNGNINKNGHGIELNGNTKGKESMGNKFSGEKSSKSNKDEDNKKKEKESKKKAKARKSKSPASDRESVIGNRSSIETTDSYSSAATLVATANAAVGKRSPKKSPRSLPRSGVKLREVVSSDDESFASGGFRTPQATTPQLKRANEQTSPSQRLLEFGKNIEREIAGKFSRKSPSTPERQNVSSDKFLSTLPKRYSRDGTIETDSDSFAMFENTEQLYATVPKDYFPIDDTLSDDVFMSCIDLAANSPDIPARSQNKTGVIHTSPAPSRKLLTPSEISTTPQQMSLSKQGGAQTSKLAHIPEPSQKSVTLPVKPKEKSPSTSKRFHSESPKILTDKPQLNVDTKNADEEKGKNEENVKQNHSPVPPRRFVVESSHPPTSSISQRKYDNQNSTTKHISSKSPTSQNPPCVAKSPSSQKRSQAYKLTTPPLNNSQPKDKPSTSGLSKFSTEKHSISTSANQQSVEKPATSSQNAPRVISNEKLTSSVRPVQHEKTISQSPASCHQTEKMFSTLPSSTSRSPSSPPTPPKHFQTEQSSSSSPLALKRHPNTKQATRSPSTPRRFPAEDYSPKIKKRIQAGNPGSPVIPRHNKKEGSKSPVLSRQAKTTTPVSPKQPRKPEAAFPVQANVTVSAQTKMPVSSKTYMCAKAEEENTQIHGSPKQDRCFLSVTKKKEHQLSTYDNVPDSDDSMAYFTDKNDPIFFEDNCVSEEIIATEKTPLHYKPDEPKKLGIEIMKAPTKAKIECVLLDREAPIPVVDAKPDITVIPNSAAVSSKSTEPLHVSEVLNTNGTVTKPEPVTIKSTTVTEKTLKPMIAVESNLSNKPIHSSKLETVMPKITDVKSDKTTKVDDQLLKSDKSIKDADQPLLKTSQIALQGKHTAVTQAIASDQSLPKASQSGVENSHNAFSKSKPTIDGEEQSVRQVEEASTEHLTKRQIRRRNKKKNLLMGSKGSMDSGSDAPLSPTLVKPEDLDRTVTSTHPVNDSPASIPFVQTPISDINKTNNTQQKDSRCVGKIVEEIVKSSCEDVATKHKDDLKLNHVPPPSPSANDALGGIVEEDEEAEDVDDIFIDNKAREVLNFGESIVKRLSSLVESQSDSNELEKRFQCDFDESTEDVSEIKDSKRSCLEVLDEICDMGEKFKKEHETDSVCEPKNLQSDASLKDSSDKLSAEGSPRIVQKRPSIPNELQIQVNSEAATSENELKRDSQRITEVISSYSEDITPTIDTKVIPHADIMTTSKQTNIVLQEPGGSSDEEYFSPERRLSDETLRVPAIEETFSELMSVKNILEEMEDKTPTSEVTPRFVGPGEQASPPSYFTGSGRRSRMSPAITERTESELDISEQLDNVSISTDSMYADDEDDDEIIISKTYTEEKGGECQVSYTFYNTSHEYDSDEFWANSSAAEENYKMLENSASQVSNTFKQARTEMHEIQRHLQDLRRQMAYLEDDVQGSTLTPSSVGSSDML